MKPTLTMAAIAGDKHIHLLPRMMRSLVDRPKGPLFDEFVLSFNGKNEDALKKALAEIGVTYSVPPAIETGQTAAWKAWKPRKSPVGDWGETAFVLHMQEWHNDFARARNENHEVATGEWVGYVDLDDRIPLPDDPAVQDSILADTPEGEIRTPIGSSTLQDYLRSQPPFVNVIVAPYHYVNSDKGKHLVRKRRPRIVKWSEGHFVWEKEVHEVYRSTIDRELRVYNAGLVFIHDPPFTAEERSERNYAILEKQVEAFEARGESLPATVAFGVAARAMDNEDWEKAIKWFDQASNSIQKIDREERLLYILYSIRARLAADRVLEAGVRARDAIEITPDRPEGYLVACECAFRMKMYDYAIKWYEAGGAKQLPVAAMLDDRVERFIRPVRTAGAAYNILGQYEKALEIAERALEIADDAFAQKVAEEARRQLRHKRLIRQVDETLDTLIEMGFPGIARRVLQQTEPALQGRLDLRLMGKKIEKALDRQPPPIPEGSIIHSWFKEAVPEDTVVLYPVDAAEDPRQLIAAALRNTSPDRDAYLVATDTQDLTGYATEARADAVTGRVLLDECEKYGDVRDIKLVEDGERRFVTAKVTRRVNRRAWKPDITFFAPVFAEPWGPWRIWRDGTGGSEESVVYLAQELASRGLNVQVYAQLDPLHRGVHVQDGVRWYPREALDMTAEIPGVTIACRAPNAIRLPAFNPDRLYVWHQDVQYPFGWSWAIARRVRSMFVSKWQRKMLLDPLVVIKDPDLLVDEFGVVCGDGIPKSALDREWGPRSVFDCVYLSSPLRGLDKLLDLWPAVLEQVPQARLHVYYGWQTTPVQYRLKREEIMTQLARTPQAVWHDRLPQMTLEEELPKMGVWLYPCVTGDTKISLPCDHRKYPDGVPIEELVGKSNFPVWSFDEQQRRFVLARATRVWKTKEVTELVELDLDDGTTLRLTPEHRLLDYDGVWKEARACCPGDRMMALHYHVITATRRVTFAQPVAVFDMTVEGTHNFIANGVVAHNCAFPEGFCIAGVRAAAAGLVPVYNKIAALPEIQYPSPFAVSGEAWGPAVQAEFVQNTVAALKASASGEFDREDARDWARKWTWDVCANLVLADMKEEGLL